MPQVIDPFYQEFGRLVRVHRKRLDMTQETLANLVGLSRTSITNVEKGRQHVLLHQVYALAGALRMQVEALLPNSGKGELPSPIEDVLPEDTEPELRDWARGLVR